MNALKKVLSWLLALTMLLSMSTTVAFAGEIMAIFSLESPQNAVKVGDTFTIPISITENKTIGSVTLVAKWDSEAFSLDKIDFSNKQVFSDAVTGGNPANGKMIISQPGVSNDTGLLAEMTFTVLDAAKAGDYTITVEAEELYDYDLNDLDCSIVPATVTVASDEPVGSAKIVVGYTENGETKYNEIDDGRLVLQAGSQVVGADYNWPMTETLYVLDANGELIEDIDWDLDDHSNIFWNSESGYPLTKSYAQVRGNTDGATATLTATLPDESTVSIEVETKTYANTVSAYNVTSEDTNYYSSYYKALIVDTGATFTLSPTKVCSGKSNELTEQQLANNTLTYACGDASILTVDAQTGEYKVVGKGETTIYMCAAGQLHGKNTVAKLKEITVFCGDAYAQDLRFSKNGTLIEKDYPVTNAFGTTYYAQTSVAVDDTQEIELTTIPAAAIENITVNSVSSASTANVTVKNENGKLKLTGVAETETPVKVTVNWKRNNVSAVSGTFATTLYVNVTEGAIAATGVTLDQESLDLVLGGTETATLTATVSPDDATDKTVIWSSSDEGVATVDENGKVTAIAVGEATITAATADGACTATCAVKVTEYVKPKTVELSVDTKSENTTVTRYNENSSEYIYVVPEGTDPADVTIQMKSKVKNGSALATNQGVDYSIKYLRSDDKVVIGTIDENGLFTWNGEYGTSQVTATAQDTTENGGHSSAALTIAITPTIATGAEIELSETFETETVTADSEVTVNKVPFGTESISASAKVTPSDTLPRMYTWIINKYNASTGKWVFVDNVKGNTEYTLNTTSFEAGDIIRMKVKVPKYAGANLNTDNDTIVPIVYFQIQEQQAVEVSSVSVEPTSLPEMQIGDTATLTATVLPEDAADKTVTWSSSNEGVATVDENGTVTAIAAGEATITATANNGVSGSCAVIVKEAETIYYATSVSTIITDVSNNKKPYSTSSNGNAHEYVYVASNEDVGFTLQGEATVYSKANPDTGLATSQNVTWKSNYDSSIASIDENGLITWNGGYGKYIAYASAPNANGGTYAGNIIIYFTPEIVSNLTAKVSDENGEVTNTAEATSYKGTNVTAYTIEDGSDIILNAVLDAPEMADYVKWTVKADSKYNFVGLSGANNSEGGKLTISPDTYNEKISADGDFKLLQITATVPSYVGAGKSNSITSETIYILLVSKAEEPVVTINEDHADMNVSAETVAEGEKVQLLLSIENDENTASKYNSYEFHVSYDPAHLTYESVSCSDGDNCAVTETEVGTLVINGYGADKAVSENAFVTLTFKANEVDQNTDTAIKLTHAYRDTSAGAIDTDIDEIKVETAEKTITIENKKASYKVTFSETVKVNGEDVTEVTVTEGESITFKVIEKTGYTFKVDGATANADGSYTVKPTANATVTITHTAKTYNVTIEGSGKDDVTASASATYGKSYAFTLNKDDSYNYTVSVKVGGQTVNAAESNGTYTISAGDVTGNIVITVIKEIKAPVKAEYTVTVYENGVANAATEKATEGDAYTKSATEGYRIYKVVMNGQEISSFTAESVNIASVTGNIAIYMGKTYAVTLPEDDTATGETEANYGSDYTFTVADGHQASATVNGQTAALTENEDGSFTIAGDSITGEIVITTEKITYAESVHVYDYVKSENATLFQLVVATAKEGALSEGEILQYNGANMFWSEKYEGYAYLVTVAADEDKLTDETAAANITKATAAATSINYAGDVNMTGSADINDAQLVYDIYKALYSDFETVSMEKLLRADMNADHEVNVSDARAVAAIVNH